MKTYLTGLAVLALGSSGWAFQIQLDYTYDAANGDFFGSHPAAKAALQGAANDINALITSPLAAVTTDTFTGSSVLSTAKIDWNLSFKNPSTGADVTLDTFTMPANTVRIYVGMQALTGSTLGEGGPAGAGFQYSVGGPSLGWQAAFNQAQSASNASMGRGAGPVMGEFKDSTGNPAYDLIYGSLAGNLWFDDDTNNDGVVDSDSILNSSWNFDLAGPVSGKNDFYSVALHELLHSIGFGTSQTWTSLESGSTWNGAQAKALNGGSGLNLVAGAHLREGLMSSRLLDGAPQEVVMDPTLLQGTRKYLTAMDAAFLRDLGYTTVPEPGAGALLLSSIAMLAFARAGRGRRRA